jgi:hypothetical protein
MPDPQTIAAAKRDLKGGKSPSTAAGEFVRQEMDHIREGKHGAKNAKQAIAIGLSEARRAGVPVPDKSTRGRKKSAAKRGASKRSTASATKKTSAARARGALKALKKQPRRAASHLALSRQAHRVARSRTAASRSASARKAARTRAG